MNFSSGITISEYLEALPLNILKFQLRGYIKPSNPTFQETSGNFMAWAEKEVST